MKDYQNIVLANCWPIFPILFQRLEFYWYYYVLSKMKAILAVSNTVAGSWAFHISIPNLSFQTQSLRTKLRTRAINLLSSQSSLMGFEVECNMDTE